LVFSTFLRECFQIMDLASQVEVSERKGRIKEKPILMQRLDN